MAHVVHRSRTHVQRRIRGVVLLAIVAYAIAAAPLAEAGHGQRSTPRATDRVQPSGAAGKHRLPRPRPLVLRLGTERAPLARHAKPKSRPRVALDVVIQGTAGTLVDGPRHTYRAIRKNPFKFTAGMVA